MKASRTGRQIVIACLFRLTALVGMLAGSAMAQTTTGAIYGTITDQSGAVIPNATV